MSSENAAQAMTPANTPTPRGALAARRSFADLLIARARAIGPVRGAMLLIAMLIQFATLVWIRLYVAGPDGGDICRDVVATQRILHGQTPYARIPDCGTLFNVPHPPAYFLLISPFALLPLPWAAFLWDLVGLAALWVSVALIARELRLAPSPWALAVLLALLLTWSPLLQTLLEAQISPLLLLLFTLTWLAARHGRSGWAGVALGVATAARLFPGLAVVYFLIRRDWRAVLMSCVVFVGMEALATPLVGGLPGVVAYATRESPAATREWLTHEHNISLWGVIRLLFVGPRDVSALAPAPWLATPLTYALLVVVLGALALRTFQRRLLPCAADDTTFLAYLPAMLLASPLTWQHYFVILLLPLLTIVARLPWLGGVAPSRVAQKPTLASPNAIHAERAERRADPGAADASRSPADGAAALRTWRARTPTRWLVALLIIMVTVVWLPTLVEASLPARPMPAFTGVLAFAMPTYALLLLFAALLWAPGMARRQHGALAAETL